MKNRRHASLNPYAQFSAPQTVEQVLEARMIVDPLTLPMCSPTTDGAAAVLVSDDYARRAGIGGVEIRSIEIASGSRGGLRPVARAAAAAYERSGSAQKTCDVIEVHDAAAPSEILQYAEIGLCGPGEGHLLLRNGHRAVKNSLASTSERRKKMSRSDETPCISSTSAAAWLC